MKLAMRSLSDKYLQKGKYLLKEKLGEGGFGITYKAINQILGRIVVIKTFKSELSQRNESSDLSQKFLNEAQRLVKCYHPNIVRFYDFFIEDNMPYIVMDYIDGPTLDQIVFPNKPLTEEIAIEYIQQISAALSVIHQNGLLHRDIKPQNLILDRQKQQVILIDFGLAREFDRKIIKTYTSLVSEGYAPIEQYLPQAQQTPATDIYGLAATLYTLVTAQTPIAASLRNRLPLDPPEQTRPELSERLSQAIMKGMALELEQRPRSIDEWLALLPKINTYKLINLPKGNSIAPKNVKKEFKSGKDQNITEKAKKITWREGSQKKNSSSKFTNNEKINSFLLVIFSLSIIIGIGIFLYSKVLELKDFNIQSKKSREVKEKKAKKIQQLQDYFNTGEYEKCVDRAQNLLQENFQTNFEFKQVLKNCQLAQSQKLAEQGLFKDAINLAQEISDEHSEYQEMQRLIRKWSEQILTLAKKKYELGELDIALSYLKDISIDNSPFYKEAQKRLARWTKEWETNKKNFQAAQAALNKSQWQEAQIKTEKLTHPYWKKEAKQIAQTSNQEIEQEKLRQQAAEQEKLRQQAAEQEKLRQQAAEQEKLRQQQNVNMIASIQSLNGQTISPLTISKLRSLLAGHQLLEAQCETEAAQVKIIINNKYLACAYSNKKYTPGKYNISLPGI